ncbi:MAG TPA: DUF167 family protein [Steroidobacteraceae bacterium]
MTARLVVHVVPRAAESAVAGRHGDALKIRIAAVPADGAANDELVRFLAKQLSVPRSAIAITAGAAARRKTVSIAGLEIDAVLRILEAR